MFFSENCEIRDDGYCWNKFTHNRISACLPMNTYGFPCKIDQINTICKKYNVPLVEDSAESLGSFLDGKHTGSESSLSTLSFNGNKIITTGGGGMILTNDKSLHQKAKHMSTTSKVLHEWHFIHDQIGFNYRMPNLNAALGLAQIEKLPDFLKSKREIAKKYQKWGDDNGVHFIKEKEGADSNYWLNCILLNDLEQRDDFLKYTNANNVMTRPSWQPMHRLDIYSNCLKFDLSNTDWIHERLINVPSSPIYMSLEK